MYVCVCHAVTDGQIREAVGEGTCSSMRELRMHLGVASSCGKCGQCAHKVLKEALDEVTDDTLKAA